jgi:inorganic pyrophosphatase
MSVPVRSDELPARTEVVVELPRFGVVKRREDGRIDYLSPLPCPFNYGSVPDTRSADGDRIDAIVLGPRLARGSRATLRVLGVVRFVDGGVEDPKWICGDRPLRSSDLLQLTVFFHVYALAKRVLNLLRGRLAASRFEGIELAPPN